MFCFSIFPFISIILFNKSYEIKKIFSRQNFSVIDFNELEKWYDAMQFTFFRNSFLWMIFCIYKEKKEWFCFPVDLQKESNTRKFDTIKEKMFCVVSTIFLYFWIYVFFLSWIIFVSIYSLNCLENFVFQNDWSQIDKKWGKFNKIKMWRKLKKTKN